MLVKCLSGPSAVCQCGLQPWAVFPDTLHVLGTCFCVPLWILDPHKFIGQWRLQFWFIIPFLQFGGILLTLLLQFCRAQGVLLNGSGATKWLAQQWSFWVVSYCCSWLVHGEASVAAHTLCLPPFSFPFKCLLLGVEYSCLRLSNFLWLCLLPFIGWWDREPHTCQSLWDRLEFFPLLFCL